MQIEPRPPASLRLFAAVPAASTPPLCELLYRLRGLGKVVRVAKPTDLHITVKFFGDVANERLASIVEATSATAHETSVARYQLAGLQGFPRWDRPNVVYATIHEHSRKDVFDGLAARFDLACESIGFARETRRFVPHVTLARIKYRPPPQLDPLMREWATVDFGEQVASELVLFHSVLRPAGPTYHRISSAELGRDV